MPGKSLAGTTSPANNNLAKASQAMFRRTMKESKATAAQFTEEDRAELQILLQSHGNGRLLLGWRRELDPEGRLKVDFQDFVQAAARMGYYGDVLGLFALDSDMETFTLEELAPREGALMRRFREWLKTRLGSPYKLFQALDDDWNGEIPRESFVSGCLALGFRGEPEDLHTVFDCIDVSGEGSAVYEEFIFLETDPQALMQAHYKAKLGKMMQWREKAAQEYLSMVRMKQQAMKEGANLHQAHRLAPRPWNEKYFEQMPTVACQAKLFRAKEAILRGRRAKMQFVDLLVRTYGCEVRALRRGLAPNTYEFNQPALKAFLTFHNSPISAFDLWNALDRDHDTTVRLEEFCTQHAFSLAAFQRWARVKFGSCVALWDTPEAAATSRRLTGTWFREKGMLLTTFKETLKSLRWPGLSSAEDRKRVFAALDLQGFGMINRSDLEWLDRWNPHEWVYAEPDPMEWERLRETLLRSYGHLLRAWRMLLDRDDSNTLTWPEFRDACRRVKFEGSAGAAWRHLDSQNTGTISMKQYDPASFELLCSFKEWAEAHFGSIMHCFRSLDEDRSGLVTFKEIKLACRKLRWQGDVRLLFDCLDTDGQVVDNKRSIALKELAFLDNWMLEPTPEEIAKADAEYAAQEPKPPCKVVAKAIAMINDRLASPVNIAKLGFSDWKTATESVSYSWGPEKPKASSCSKLPRLVPDMDSPSPYAEKLWGRSISALTQFRKRGGKDTLSSHMGAAPAAVALESWGAQGPAGACAEGEALEHLPPIDVPPDGGWQNGESDGVSQEGERLPDEFRDGELTSPSALRDGHTLGAHGCYRKLPGSALSDMMLPPGTAFSDLAPPGTAFSGSPPRRTALSEGDVPPGTPLSAQLRGLRGSVGHAGAAAGEPPSPPYAGSSAAASAAKPTCGGSAVGEPPSPPHPGSSASQSVGRKPWGGSAGGEPPSPPHPGSSAAPSAVKQIWGSSSGSANVETLDSSEAAVAATDASL